MKKAYILLLTAMLSLTMNVLCAQRRGEADRTGSSLIGGDAAETVSEKKSKTVKPAEKAEPAPVQKEEKSGKTAPAPVKKTEKKKPAASEVSERARDESSEAGFTIENTGGRETVGRKKPVVSKKKVEKKPDKKEADNAIVKKEESEEPDDASAAEKEEEPLVEKNRKSDIPESEKSLAEKRLDQTAFKLRMKKQARHAEAMSLIEAGKREYNQLRYREAAKLFKEALSVEPGNKEAQKYHEKSLSLIGERKDRIRNQAEWLTDKRTTQIRQVRIEIEAYINDGRRLFEQAVKMTDNLDSDPNIALKVLVNSDSKLKRADKKFRHVIETAKFFPYQEDTTPYITVSEKYITDIKKERNKNAIKIKELKARVAREEAEKEVAKRDDYLRVRTSKLMEKAIFMYDRGDFAEAEDVCHQVLKLDPKHSEAEKLMKKSRKKKHQKRSVETANKRKEEMKSTMEDIRWAAVPYSDDIRYPEDWKEIEAKRKMSTKGVLHRTPEWKKQIRREMRKPVTFDFVATSFSEVIDVLRNLTGLNIVVDRKSIQDKMDLDEPIDLKVSNMPFEAALKWVLRSKNLKYDLVKEAIYITTTDKVTGETFMQIYDISDFTRPINNFPGPSIDISEPGGETSTGISLDTDAASTEGMDADYIATLIRERIDPTSWDADAGTAIVRRGDKLIVKHNEVAHQKITDLLNELRKSKQQQVSVQARFIDVKKGFLDEIGVQWQGLDQASVTDTSGNAPQGAGFLSDITKLDDYDARVATANPASPSTLGATWASDIVGSGINSGATRGLIGQYTMLGNVQAEAIFHAIRKEGEGTTLTAPKITVFNNRRAHIVVATQYNYVYDYTLVGGTFDPEITAFLEGVVLDVKPTISSDRKYITLEIQPTVGTVGQQNSITITALGGIGGGDQGTGALQTLDLTIQTPQLLYEQVRTTVNIPDQGIMMLGGLMRGFSVDRQSGVPFLQHLPIIGRLFKTKGKGRQDRSLVIMITAKILLFDEIESKL